MGLYYRIGELHGYVWNNKCMIVSLKLFVKQFLDGMILVTMNHGCYRFTCTSELSD